MKAIFTDKLHFIMMSKSRTYRFDRRYYRLHCDNICGQFF